MNTISIIIKRSIFELNRLNQKLSFSLRAYLEIDKNKSINKKLFRNILNKKQLISSLNNNLININKIDESISNFSISTNNSIIKQADKVIAGKINILFQERTFKIIDGFISTDWHTDFKTGYSYKKGFAFDTMKKNAVKGVDIKNIWELSRMQFLIAPAIAWRITKNDKYASFVCNTMLDWIEKNEYAEGPNWNMPMEIGIRLVNFTLAFCLIINSDLITNEIAKRLISSIYLQLEFIMKNLERYRGRTYNHYMGNLIGVLISSSLLLSFGKSKKYLKFAVNSFEEEMKRQILSDGGSFEGTTCYQGLIGEIFAEGAIICQNCKIQLSEEFYVKLKKMVIFNNSIKIGDEIVQIGDNDSGRVLCVIPENPLSYLIFNKIANLALQFHYMQYESSDFFDIICNNHIDRYFENFDTENINIQIFDKSQIAVIKNIYYKVILCATEAQKYGFGGHTHNDKLSVSISIFGKKFIVDPGSGCYTENHQISKYFRSIHFHNTVIVDDMEQNVKQCENVFGNSYEAKSILESNNDTLLGRVQVDHNRVSYVHKRIINIYDNKLLIEDEVASTSCSVYLINYVLHPNVKVFYINNNIILDNDGLKLMINGHDWKIKDSYYSSKYGDWVETKALQSKKYNISTCPIHKTVFSIIS